MGKESFGGGAEVGWRSVLEGDDGVDPVDVVRAVPEHAGEVVGVGRVVELNLAAEAPVLREGVDFAAVVHHLAPGREGREGEIKWWLQTKKHIDLYRRSFSKLVMSIFIDWYFYY